MDEQAQTGMLYLPVVVGRDDGASQQPGRHRKARHRRSRVEVLKRARTLLTRADRRKSPKEMTLSEILRN